MSAAAAGCPDSSSRAVSPIHGDGVVASGLPGACLSPVVSSSSTRCWRSSSNPAVSAVGAPLSSRVVATAAAALASSRELCRPASSVSSGSARAAALWMGNARDAETRGSSEDFHEVRSLLPERLRHHNSIPPHPRRESTREFSCMPCYLLQRYAATRSTSRSAFMSAFVRTCNGPTGAGPRWRALTRLRGCVHDGESTPTRSGRTAATTKTCRVASSCAAVVALLRGGGTNPGLSSTPPVVLSRLAPGYTSSTITTT